MSSKWMQFIFFFSGTLVLILLNFFALMRLFPMLISLPLLFIFIYFTIHTVIGNNRTRLRSRRFL